MRTNGSMSVYNRYTNPSTRAVTFKKHLIDNVMWNEFTGVVTNDGHAKEDKVSVFIPKDINDITGYVKPKLYAGSSDQWTLENGDLIVRGNINIAEVSGIKELSDYEAFTITSVNDTDFGSPNMHHFEISGN